MPSDKIVSIEFRVTITDINGPGGRTRTRRRTSSPWQQVSPDVVSYGLRQREATLP